MIDEELLQRANDGDFDAIVDVGNAYFFGRGVEEDNDAAGIWFRKAYDLQPDNPRALNSMGNAYKYGCGVEKNEMLAMQFFRKAAMMDHAPAQYNYANGLRDRGDEECIVWYEKAYQNGDSDAADKLGGIYLDGELVEKDEFRGIKYLQKAIDMRNTHAMVNLGYYYINTEKGRLHLAQGMQLMQQAADGGNATAAANLSVYYRREDIVPRNVKRSLEWAYTAAERGDYEQLYWCGWLSKCGESGMPKDPEKGLRLMEEAYEGGYKLAAKDIADCYSQGTGTSRDPEKAAVWYERAIRSGDKWAYLAFRDFCRGMSANYSERYLSLLQEMCEADVPTAMTNLAESYLTGEFTEQDKDLAMEWFDKAIAQGDFYACFCKALELAKDPKGDQKEIIDLCYRAIKGGEYRAQILLGYIYYEGKTVPRDIPKAIELLEKAVGNGEYKASYYLGKIFHDKSLDVYDPYKAFTCYKLAWEASHMIDATVALADMLRLGDEIPQDGQQAITYYRYAAECDDCFGYSGLALCALGGIGMEEDRKAAKEYLLKAKELGHPAADTMLEQIATPEERFETALELAKQGDPAAQFRVCYYYDAGCGVEKNDQAAYEWCVRAAQNGNIEALAQQGLYELRADRVITAAHLFEKAADGGNAIAAHNLAVLYYNGKDPIPADKEKAFLWYVRAAELGFVDAMRMVSICYLTGDGTQKNTEKSFKWCRKAAEQGDASCMEHLGIAYALGDGVSKDLYLARFWLEKAVASGRESAKKNLDIAMAQLEKETQELAGEQPMRAQQNTAPALHCPHCNASVPVKKLPKDCTLPITCPKCSKTFTVCNGEVVSIGSAGKGQSVPPKSDEPVLMQTCDHCGAKIQLKNPPLGKPIEFTCPKCGKQFKKTIPGIVSGKRVETSENKADLHQKTTAPTLSESPARNKKQRIREAAKKLHDFERYASTLGYFYADNCRKTYVEHPAYTDNTNSSIYVHLVCDTSKISMDSFERNLALYNSHISSKEYRDLSVRSMTMLFEWGPPVFDAINAINQDFADGAFGLEGLLLDNIKVIDGEIVSSQLIYHGDDSAAILKAMKK